MSTLIGWRAYCDGASNLSRPESMSMGDYRGLPEAARISYDEARMRWLLNGMIVNTAEQERAIALLRVIMLENRLRNSGEQALLVTGEPTLGKTTLAKKLGRRVEAQVAEERPDYRRDGVVPVIYADAPSNGSGKQLLAALDSFTHGSVRPSRMTQEDLLRCVIQSIHQFDVRLVVVDEAHLLAEQRQAAQDPTDVLKQIQNATAATILVAGIDLLTPHGLATRRGAQLLDRAEPLEVRRFTTSTTESLDYWRSLLHSFDAALPLIGHEPGLLVANQQLIHEATKGSIGLVNKLVARLVGVVLAHPGRTDERITAAMLDDVLSMVANAARTATKLRKANASGGLVSPGVRRAG